MVKPLILNRYRILETRGKGAFGTVDVAWDNRLQRRVAIKRITLSVHETDLPGIQEARTAAMLNHAHIVTVLDFQVTGTEALIIMEYVDGPTLGALLKESTALFSLDMVTSIINDVASALEYAHENQVLHLDIKPDNILVDHQGQVKVSDFGLSQLSGIAGFEEARGGTIGYMPPEQLYRSDVDGRTDLWALAMLLYQLLTGINPFYARTVSESLDYILNEPLTVPSTFRPELSPEADDIIIKAMMADKDHRFGSVSEFLSRILPFLGNTQAGRKELKYYVNDRDLNELVLSDAWHQEDNTDFDAAVEEEDMIPKSVPLWDRLSQRTRGFFGRLVAAVACGSFTCLGLSGFDLLSYNNIQTNIQFVLLVGIIALVALGAFMVPQLGSALACAILITGVFARGLLVVAIVLALLLIAWWVFFGRKGALNSTVVTLTPLMGVLWMGFALPMLTGYFLRWKHALGAALIQGLLLIVIAAMTGGSGLARTSLLIPEQNGLFPEEMLAFLANPKPWILLVAFVLSALVMSLLAQRNTRWSALLGTLLAVAILALGCVATSLVFDPSILLVNLASDGASLALSFILLLIMSLLGVSASTARTKEV